MVEKQHKAVRVTVPNVWIDGVKLYRDDVVALSASDAAALKATERAVDTKDDETVIISDGIRVDFLEPKIPADV